MKEQWANGNFSASLEAEMVARNAGATGAASAFQDVIEVTIDELLHEESNEE